VTKLIKWVFALVLILQAHFALTYLVPAGAGHAWIGWPWAVGDSGPLGTLAGSGTPVIGVWLAGLAGLAFIIAALGVLGIWVPAAWWRPAAMAAGVLSFAVMSLFFGPSKIPAMVLDVFVVAGAAMAPAAVTA
jgi:hypothetical protein